MIIYLHFVQQRKNQKNWCLNIKTIYQKRIIKDEDKKKIHFTFSILESTNEETNIGIKNNHSTPFINNKDPENILDYFETTLKFKEIVSKKSINDDDFSGSTKTQLDNGVVKEESSKEIIYSKEIKLKWLSCSKRKERMKRLYKLLLKYKHHRYKKKILMHLKILKLLKQSYL